jgi:lysophospholipase L1-like esterase
MTGRFPLPLTMRFRIFPLALGLLLAAAPVTAPVVVAAPELAPYQLAIPAIDDGLPGVGPLRRHTWFQKLWWERRQKWAAAVDADQGAIVFLGDSITQGWGEDFKGHFSGLKVANRGISGDTTRGVLLRMEEDVIALNPAAVVLLIGTNDIEEVARADAITSNLSLIIARLQAHRADLPIILCQVFPSSAAKKRGPELIQDVNARYLAAVKGNAGVIVLDTWTLFADATGDAKAEEMPDLLHPNKIGYDKWAAALHPLFATLGFVDTTPDRNWQPEPGFTALFNGHDLTGWGYRPTSESDRAAARRWQANSPDAAEWPFVETRTDFDGLAQSPDQRFAAINGRLVVTTPPRGRVVQQLWTTREFPEDFILKLEFRATPNADSGIYLRGPQLQCRDYALAGPWKDLPHYRSQAWNEIVITVRDGVAHATCNGDLLTAKMAVPATGPIGFEGDRGQTEYRRIRYQAL